MPIYNKTSCIIKKDNDLEESDINEDYINDILENNKKSNQVWAQLIQKVYEVDPLTCPLCKSEMKIIAVIIDPDEIKKILSCLKKNKSPPFSEKCKIVVSNVA